MRLWLGPKRAQFKKDQVVRHAQLPRLLGRILGVTIDREKIYYRIEWIDGDDLPEMGMHVEQRYLKRIDPLTALATVA